MHKEGEEKEWGRMSKEERTCKEGEKRKEERKS